MEEITTSQPPAKKKTKKMPIFTLIFAIFLVIAMILGFSLSIWGFSKSYSASEQFTQSLNVRFQISPASQEDLSYDDSQGRLTVSEEDAINRTKQAAENFSEWLKTEGYANYDVKFDVAATDEGPIDHVGYLSVNVPIEKFESGFKLLGDDNEINQNPIEQIFNLVNTNQRSVVYRWSYEAYPGPNSVYTVIPFSSLFSISKNDVIVTTDENDSIGVAFKVRASEVMNAIFKDLSEYSTLNPDETDNSKKPELFVINNLNMFINQANYYLSLGKSFQLTEIGSAVPNDTTGMVRETWNNYYLFNNQSVTTFVKDVMYGSSIYNTSSLNFGHFQPCYFKAPSGVVYPNAFYGGDLFRFINGSDGTNYGSVSYDWMNKYVQTVITVDNYGTYFPEEVDKISGTNDVENSNISFFFWNFDNNIAAAEQLVNEVVNLAWEVPVSKIRLDDSNDAWVDFLTISGFDNDKNRMNGNGFNYSYQRPEFSQSIFGNFDLIAVIGLGFLVFLLVLLIILMMLYRTTGLFAWLTLMFSLSITLLIVISVGAVVSLGLIFGTFILAIVGTILIINVCEKMRKFSANNVDKIVAINKSFMKTHLTAIDFLVLTLLFGVCFIFFSSAIVVPIGVMLIIGSIFNYAFGFLFNWLMNYCFFYNEKISQKSFLFLKPAEDKTQPFVLNQDVIMNTSLPGTKQLQETQNINVIEKQKPEITKPETKSFTGSVKYLASKFWINTKYYSSKFSLWFKTHLKPQTLESPERIPTSSRFNTTFSGSKLKKLNIFNSWWYVLLGVIFCLLIAGLVVFGVLGITNTILFENARYCVVIYDPNQLLVTDFSSAVDYHWYDGFWYVYFENNEVANLFSTSAMGMLSSAYGSTIPFSNVTTIVGNTNVDTLISGIATLSIASALVLAYSLIRLNWTCFVPMLISLILGSFLTIGVGSIFMIYFNQNIIFALAIVFIINAIITINMLSNLNAMWSRKEIYSNVEYRYMINKELKNSFKFYILIFSLLLFFSVMFGLIMPIGLTSLLFIMIIGFIVSLIITFYVVPWMYYWMVTARMKNTKKTLELGGKKAKKDLDKVDEQLVDGINTSHKSPIKI